MAMKANSAGIFLKDLSGQRKNGEDEKRSWLSGSFRAVTGVCIISLITCIKKYRFSPLISGWPICRVKRMGNGSTTAIPGVRWNPSGWAMWLVNSRETKDLGEIDHFIFFMICFSEEMSRRKFGNIFLSLGTQILSLLEGLRGGRAK